MTTKLGALLAAGRTAQVYAWTPGKVIKLYREWAPRDWVVHEQRIAQQVFAAGLAAPEPGDIVEIDGRVGLIYERLDGASMLEAMQRRLFVFASRHARRLADLHVAMHRQRVPTFVSVKERLRRDIAQAPGLSSDAREAVLRRLDMLPDADALCHGDFHPGNVLETERGPIVIDWVTAGRGPAPADVARTLLLLSTGRPPGRLAALAFAAIATRFRRAYLARYRESLPAPDDQLREWLSVVAAARLNERIAGEQALLMTLVQQGAPVASAHTGPNDEGELT